MDFSFTCHTDTGRAVETVTVSGELDLESAPLLDEAFDAAHTGGVHRIVVDLTGLEFMDSTGIGALVTGNNAATGLGGWLRVTGASGMPLRALELTGIADLLCAPPPDDGPDEPGAVEALHG